MKMENKLLSIKQIVEDAELYPRHINDPKNWCDWQTVYRYSESYKSGAQFPPISVAFFAGRYYLTDGKHRIEMYKQNKVDTIECLVWKANSRKEILIEAIKSNVVHGRTLSSQDRAEDIRKLRAMDIEDMRISEIIGIPFEKLSSFVANRLTNTLTGEDFILKAPLKGLAGLDVDPSLATAQEIFAARSTNNIVEEMLRLLESGVINWKNPSVVNKLKIISKLIREGVLKKRRK